MPRIPTYTIYTLRDESGAVRYVGCTSQPPKWRLQQHKHAKTTVGKWVRSEIDAGRGVEMVIEEQIQKKRFSYDAASRVEKQYINGYRRLLGDFLLNRDGPRVCKRLSVSHADAELGSHMTPRDKRLALLSK